MKKLLLMLAMILPMIAFTACSNDGSPIHKEEQQDTDELKSIVGTWENGKYFVSFGEDGFYSAYIANEFIDSGDYKQLGNKISCLNNYFNRETIYTIKDISDLKMEAEILYTDLHGETNSTTIIFTKSDKDIVSKSNTLSGKSITTYSSYFGTVTKTFTSFNAGVKTATKGSAAKYPINYFYIYIGNVLYHQELYNNSIQIPSIGGWSTDYNKVKCWELSFAHNGTIKGFDDIDLE